MNKLKYLTQRDKTLLQTVDSFGLLSTSQIRKLLFENVSPRTMLRRLQVLKKRNFLQSVDGLPRGEQSWFLTNTSARFIGSTMNIKGVNKNTLYHDILVSDLRISLDREYQTSHWKNGHWLAHQASLGIEPNERFKTVVPDSIFMMDTNQGLFSVALELELVKKAKKRYQHIFREYLRKKEIGFLWYVVPTQKMGEHLISLLPTADYGRQTLSFFWSHLDNVLHSPKEVVLHGNEFSLPLKEFAKAKKELGFPDFSKPHSFSTETSQTPAHSDAHTVSDPDDYDHL